VREHVVSFSDICSLIAFFAYAIATSAMLLRLFHPKGPNLVFVLFFGCLGMVLHTLSSAQFLVAQPDINFALPNVISLVSLVICLSISAFALRFKVNLLLPVIYGFAGIWQLLMVFIPNVEQAPLINHDLSVVSHVSLALLSYCILVIATLYAFQVAYINIKLKTKNLTAVSHLPPLMQVEGQLFIILAIGTCLLFFSQVIGFLFLDGMISHENLHKTVLSILAFLIYSATLWGHYKKGWRGHRVLILTITGSALLTLAYFGSRFVKEFILL
jgi:ABC-type uncharacterized transport system permease subunit